jgi:hypothetical protein
MYLLTRAYRKSPKYTIWWAIKHVSINLKRLKPEYVF